MTYDFNEPLFSCSQEGCREECSYPADMLALHNGAPICEDCYSDLPFKSQAPDPDDDQETLSWHDLPRFVPPFVRRIKALEARVEALEAALGWFVNDQRFVVQVGGSPYVVPHMIEAARAVLLGKEKVNIFARSGNV